jgi:hypothetical protein
MANQGNLFSAVNQPATAVAPEPPPEPHRQIPRWLRVAETTLFVVIRLYLGAWLVLLPWRSIWTNVWITHWPSVAAFIAQGWVRGIVSGLGLLNIWIAFSVFFQRKHRY